MRIRINERTVDVADGESLHGLRRRFKPDADVVILNGAPASGDHALAEGDEVCLVRRGEVPGLEELEALMAARHTPGVHEKVKRSSVGIAGLGGLGSSIAVALSRVGVGRLVLVDFDVVEPSNLNRQQYFIDQLGMPKVEALVANLRRINPYVRYEAHCLRLDPDNVPRTFADVDVLVEAFDRPEAKVMLLESFATAFPDRPMVMASGLAGHAPGTRIRITRLGRHVYVVGDLESAAAPAVGSWPPVSELRRTSRRMSS